ncbi:MAG: aminodeoxychorismate/anthranilate synthase component II [Clostridiales Family XIII bacterium]|nr:aminodeoxychorismate/anthranilate synthase component II [Clostridiales Family XIII bacterium]
MIALIDNYDSFSYNLYQQIGEAYMELTGKAPDIRVLRNDETSARGIINLSPTHIVMSPGPGRPENAGVCMDIAVWAGGRIPVLGVCLGHQAICASLGARVSYAKELMHGKSSTVALDNRAALFRGMPPNITVGRYHSLAVIEETLPDAIAVTARADDGEIMGIAHRDLKLYGVQFHPESVLTPDGACIMRNFLGSVA